MLKEDKAIYLNHTYLNQYTSTRSMILLRVVLYWLYFQVFWQGGGVLPGGGLLPSEVPHRGIHQGHQGRRGQAQIGPHTHSQVSNPPLRNK